MEAIHFDAQHEISAGHKINVPEIHTSRISPYPGNKNHPVTIVSALIMEKGGINASNLDLNTVLGCSVSQGGTLCAAICTQPAL